MQEAHIALHHGDTHLAAVLLRNVKAINSITELDTMQVQREVDYAAMRQARENANWKAAWKSYPSNRLRVVEVGSSGT